MTPARSKPAHPLVRLWRTVGLTRTGTVVLVAAVAGWVVARALGGRTLFLIVYGVVVALLVARFLGRGRLRLAAERSEIPPRLRQGQSAPVRLLVQPPRRGGLFILQEQMHPHVGRVRTLPVTAGRGGAVEYDYTVTPRLRGVYEIGPLVAIWSDPFGLTSRTTEILPASRVVVHPSTEPVTDRPITRQWEDPPVRPPNSRPWPTGFEFYGMRDYVRGDDMRRVVWRAVARTGRMLIRESEQGITDQVAILIDTDRSRHSAGDPSDTFEAAVKTAASLATRHLRDGFSVTVYGNDGQLCPPARGDFSRIPVLDALAAVQPGATPLVDALDHLVTHGRRDAHTLVITPYVDEQIGARCRLLLDRGTRVVVVVLAWEDSDPATLQFAGAIGTEVVVLRPLASLDASFRAGSEAALAGSEAALAAGGGGRR